MANEFTKTILAIVEVEVEKLIKERADELLEAGFTALKKTIPGTLDDLLLETLKPTIKAEAIKAALKLAEKIDGVEA